MKAISVLVLVSLLLGCMMIPPEQPKQSVQQGAADKIRTEDQNNAPMISAITEGNIREVESLLAAGADPNLPGIFIGKDTEGKKIEYELYPLPMALFTDTISAAQKIRLVQLFQKYGADFNRIDDSGMTLLYKLLFWYSGM